MPARPGQIANFEGKLISPLSFDPSHWDIRDIAQALSRENRWGGRGRTSINVADHSFCVSIIAEHESKRRHESREDTILLAKLGWAHDIEEAFVRDTPAPFKALPEFAPIVAMGLRLRCALFRWLNLPICSPELPEGELIQDIDRRIRANEARHLFPERDPEWVLGEPIAFPDDFLDEPVAADVAEGLFLERFAELWPERAHEAGR